MIIVNLARLAVPADTATGSDRTRYQKLYDDGNYKDAYDGFRKLVLDRKDDPTLVAGDLNKGAWCIAPIGPLGRSRRTA